MAKVSLRIYNREIGTLIDQGQVTEAIAHCHHILKTFPKHLETYRLLGKAYLEAGRYNDAGDIFSRVLMAVPNDFVSHAGMSVIADEKGKLDEAIWHMQRAFESHPSNTAVQGELQRLYGRRDGVEPPKIRMTNGALAHVYLQGELYAQAIAEIRSVEAQEPERMDMRVLLAYAYFRSGQRVEASQVAASLLAKSPYCFDANRILVEILPETSRADSVQTYRKRVNALDPYAAFVKDSVFNADSVPDAAVSLERLVWQGGDTPLLSGGWKNSEGIQADEQPAWLKAEDNARDLEPDSAKETDSGEDQIPDFMRAAGWGSSSGEAEEAVSFFDTPDSAEEETEEAEIAQAELPDWMKTMAPAEAALLADDENEMGEDDMASDDWINDLLGNEDGEEDAAPAEKAEAGDLPDWLQEAAEESAEAVEASVSAAGDLVSDTEIGELGASADDQDAAMAWLESLAAKQGAKAEELITDPAERTDAAPEWVEQAKEIGGKAEDKLAAAEEKVEAEIEEDLSWLEDKVEDAAPAEKAEAGDLPDWLQEAAEESAEAVEAGVSAAGDLVSDTEIGELGASADDQDAAMAWLESLAAKQGAKAEELITDPAERTDAAPEWVEQAKEIGAKEAAVEAEGDLAWIADAAQEDAPAEDIPAWLEEAENEQPTDESAEDEAPAWIRDAEVKASTKIKTRPRAEKTDWIREAADETPPPETEAADDTPKWLKDEADDYAEEVTVVEETERVMTETTEVTTAETEDAPTWVKAMDLDAAETVVSESEAISAEDDLPAWLADMGGETTDTASVTEIVERESLTEQEQTSASAAAGTESAATLDEKILEREVSGGQSSVSAGTVSKSTLKRKKRIRRMDTATLRDITLMGAQVAMDEGNISASLKEYAKLIRKKRLLDEVIYDLREALDEYPINIDIWQLLGDAYLRAGRLQEAIDAYTNAEKLLR
jgi:cytochrome c-type biogenesis protein CcmH/NrfG